MPRLAKARKIGFGCAEQVSFQRGASAVPQKPETVKRWVRYFSQAKNLPVPPRKRDAFDGSRFLRRAGGIGTKGIAFVPFYSGLRPESNKGHGQKSIYTP